VIPEAKLEGGAPQTAGWFVVSARDARWLHNEMGHYCGFEGKADAAFADQHVIVGAGDEPALVLAVGARKGRASYPVDGTAVRHGAGVEREVASPAEAYANYSRPQEGPAPELA
jgi:hypothetical protein